MTIKGRLQMSMSNLKQFSVENFKESPVKNGPQNCGFEVKGGLQFTFWFCDLKRHILARNRVF